MCGCAATNADAAIDRRYRRENTDSEQTPAGKSCHHHPPSEFSHAHNAGRGFAVNELETPAVWARWRSWQLRLHVAVRQTRRQQLTPDKVPVRHRERAAGSTPPESAHQRGPRGPSDPRGGRAGQAVVHTRTPTPDRRWPHDRGCRPPKASPPPLEHELRAPPGYRARLPLPLRAFGLRTGPGRSLTMRTRLPPAASPNASPCPSDELVLGSLRICASRRGAERYIVRIRRARGTVVPRL
ncbi:hypothetical protein C8Q76DRAFT_786146 [Earliella scabrosa]|nr:hypothetical protein C8Q76DRAFT_786146 [Earliella scabrosa]